ncbi:flagellinolysin [Eubacteriaceae bacterium ES3]|nr:flagellinolysin [Eubacteriaceae bacterium ES3]
MRINHNMTALNSYGQLNQNNTAVAKSIEKLSSGLSINKAGDNAAGLAISEKMRGQIRGLDQADKNTQNAISMIETAEGALNETHSIIQRIRELSVQAANDTNATEDREAIQLEIDELVKDVDRIGNNTEYNTIKLLNKGNASMSMADQQNLISSLKKYWLFDAEKLVEDSYGLTADNVSLTVEFTNDTSSSYAAMVVGSYTYVPGDTVGAEDITGKGSNLTLKINMAYSQPTDTADGGTYPQYVDRVIAHEMTHAVMMRTMNFGDLSTWFSEGVAEFTHGGDERLESAIASLGSINAVVANFGTGAESDWNGVANDYGSAYLAVRYMDQQIKAEGGTGVKEVLQYLKDNPNDTLDDALADAKNNYVFLTFNDSASFVADFTASVSDATYVAETGIILDAGAEDDTGSATGSEGGTGGDLNAEDIMSETGGAAGAEEEQPLDHFTVIWPNLSDSVAQSFTMQIGANTGQKMTISTSDMRAEALGLDEIRVTSHSQANTAISTCDSAMTMVSAERSRLGAYQNRLEHTSSNLMSASGSLSKSESQIRDVDMANEMMTLTKQNILMQSAQAMLSQANQQPQGVMQLLA